MEKLSLKYEVLAYCLKSFENAAESFKEQMEDYKKREANAIEDGETGEWYKAQWEEYEAKYNIAKSILSDLAKKL